MKTRAEEPPRLFGCSYYQLINTVNNSTVSHSRITLKLLYLKNSYYRDIHLEMTRRNTYTVEKWLHIILILYALIKLLMALVVSQPASAAANLPTNREIACFGIRYCRAIFIFWDNTKYSLKDIDN